MEAVMLIEFAQMAVTALVFLLLGFAMGWKGGGLG